MKIQKNVYQINEKSQVLTAICALVFDDYNLHGWSDRNWRLPAAFILMAMYELWWIRYFQSERKLSDFYSSFPGIPLAGATLPVSSFFLPGIYGKVIWLIMASVIPGIGHIGIHMQHGKELNH